MTKVYKNLWDQIWGQLDKFIGGGRNLQLVYPFIDWTWNVPPPGYIDSQVYNLVNQMPEWSAIGKYSPSATGLYQAYINMLPTCVNTAVPHPAQQQQIKEVENQLNAAQTTLTSNISAMYSAFAQAQKVPQGVPPPQYAEWYKSSGWEARINSSKKNVDRLTVILADIVDQQLNPGYENAIKAATMPTEQFVRKPGFAKCSINGNDDWRANYILSNGQDWVNQLTQGGGTPLNLSLDASENSNHMSQSLANGATDHGAFFGIFVNGSWQELNMTQKDSGVKVNINIKAVTQVPIVPDSWYDAGYLKVLASKGHWNQPYATKGGAHPVFGKGGVMPLMITGLVAGYQIGFDIHSMSCSTTLFPEYESQLHATTGVRIGPFQIGSSNYSINSADKLHKTVRNGSFSGYSKATYPSIIGFTVASPGLS